MKTVLNIICMILLCTVSVYGQGKLIDDSFFSTSLSETRMVDVYLPEVYDPSDTTKRFPVVYYLHGAFGDQNSNDELISTLNLLILTKTINPLIMVKPDGSKGPWSGSMFTNSEMYGAFEDYIAYDLVSYIDSTYNTIRNRNKRCIMGYSMGGYGSMKLYLKHPELFGAVASHSGILNFIPALAFDILGMLKENGGSGPFDPNKGLFSNIVFSDAGAFSPNFDNPQYPQHNVDLYVDNNGNIIDSTYTKWIHHSPAYLATQFSPDSICSIYFDHGLQDDIVPVQSDSMFADDLDSLGILYEFQTFKGDHFNQLTNRFPIALRFLNSVMITTAIEDNYKNLLSSFILSQNYPNPFNPSTTIEFQIPPNGVLRTNSQFTTLKVYDILGKEVSTLVSKKLNQGNHTYTFDGKNLASGIYYYQLVAGEYREVKKMILLR